jgi:hypothetical protein
VRGGLGLPYALEKTIPFNARWSAPDFNLKALHLFSQALIERWESFERTSSPNYVTLDHH